MTGLELSFITGPHERVLPLIDGRVRVEGLDDIKTTISDASVTFWRQLTFWEFEISEMSRPVVDGADAGAQPRRRYRLYSTSQH